MNLALGTAFFTSFYPFWGFSYWITDEKPWVWRNYSHSLEFEQSNIICIIIHCMENLSADIILHLWSLILKKEMNTLYNLSLQLVSSKRNKEFHSMTSASMSFRLFLSYHQIYFTNHFTIHFYWIEVKFGFNYTSAYIL